MTKESKPQLTFPTNKHGQPVDPYTGEELIPIEELEAAAKLIPKRNGRREVKGGAKDARQSKK